MRFRQKLELVADARRNLIAAQFLFEADKSEVEDGYWIHKDLGRVLGVPVFKPCKPVVREGVVASRCTRL
jgi:hypothetical protein